jgi:hypothetical protein
MTPLKTANAIAASASGVTGGLVYRGSYDASLQTPDLTTASKGDFYIVSVAGSLDAQPLNIGDHIVFNQDASSPVTSAMFDTIDNTDAVSSVNGQTGVVNLTATDVSALASGDNISELTNDAGYLTPTLSTSITVDTDGAYDLGTESAGFDKIYGNLEGAVCFKASNASGAQILKGQPVYISGVSGDVPEVSLADADAAAMPSAGLAGETANAGAEVRIITFGNLEGVNTSAFSLGDTLYIDTTAGALTATPPAGEAAKLQNIGKVIRVHATEGVIKVGGAGRSAATPNLDQNKIFLGDSNNRAVSTALSAVALSSFNNDLGLAPVATTGAYSDLSGTPTLGTAAALDTGTSANNVVQLDGSARLPAVDASQLTNLPSSGISNLVEDTSPQLGNNLDPNGFGISGNLVPSTANNRSLGSSSAEWSDLYIGDQGKIFFGNDQDVELIHDPDDGLILDLGVTEASNDPQFELRSQNSGTIGPRLKFNQESTSPATNDRIGIISFTGKDSGGTEQEYSKIQGMITDTTAGAEVGRISILATPGIANTRGLQGEGVSGQAGYTKVNIDHDGNNYGLHLNNTLVTARATELNLLDSRNSTVGSSITIADTDGFIVKDGTTTKLIPASDIKTYAAAGASAASETTAGIIEIATNAEAGAGTATDKALVPSNVSSLSLSSSQVTGLATVATSGAYSDLSGTPTLGTAAALDVGTSANNVVQLDGSARLPAVDGSQLTNLPSSGGVTSTLTVQSSASYTLSASDAPGIHIWYGTNTTSAFTVTMPDIANVLSTAASVGGVPVETFEVYVGRARAGDITISAADGIDLLGDGTVSYATTQTVNAGQWVKLVGWYVSGTTQRYIMDSAAQPRDAALDSISGLTTSADQLIYTTASDTYATASLTAAGRALLDDADAATQRGTLGLGTSATLDAGTSANNVVQLDGSARLPAVDGSQLINLPSSGGGWTYSAISADPANAQTGYHYSCTGSFTLTLPTTGVSAGEEVRIKNMGTGTITIDPQTSNIDGSTTDYVMDIQYSAITLVSTGTHWEVI